jgi:hypothetical protein
MLSRDERAKLIMKDFLDFIKRWDLDCSANQGDVVIGWYTKFTHDYRDQEGGVIEFDYCDSNGFSEVCVRAP